MKIKTIIQFNDTEVIAEDLSKIVKEELKVQGVKMVNIDTLDVYYKPEENAAYYVVTLKDGESLTGSVNL